LSIISLSFIVFILFVFVIYYVVPKKFQWVVLLLSSVFFYLMCGFKSFLYVLITTTTIYFATRYMASAKLKQKAYLRENKESLTKEQKTKYKNKIRRKRKAAMLITLFVNIGILCVFKYTNFAIQQINAVSNWFTAASTISPVSFVIPLGISFYTFQSIGYLMDVYWEYYEPEHNYFKVLLFVSFFPQMT